MSIQKYTVNQYMIESLLTWVKDKEIVIPEIQRPFVWESAKVRDLIDSLYQGYPIGYIISWKNPNIRLKNGQISEGKKILIDGQQRITALTTAILGEKIVDKNYKQIQIKIAFNPIEEKFETLTPAISKNKKWIKDISIITKESMFKIIREYFKLNSDIENEEQIERAIEKLFSITKKQIGMIELSPELDIEEVTEIFIRINSKGVELSQADFAMSKIAANEKYNGTLTRKIIDYFSHLAVNPSFEINDEEFKNSKFFQTIIWLKKENLNLYIPTYKDILRVAFTYKFNRGRLSDLVSLLSGRNFETRNYEEEIEKESFKILNIGIEAFINEYNFKTFLMIILSAGFIDKKLIRSQNALNFAYILYLKLKEQKYPHHLIDKFVKKWFVLSLLTGRYSGSPESIFDEDIKKISKKDFNNFLKDIEEAKLSNAFWDFELIQKLETSVASNPVFNVFLASQCYFNDKAFLSKDMLVKYLIEQRGDIHHIFPKKLLQNMNYSRGMYNQVANYVYIETNPNIKIGKTPIEVYINEVLTQCETKNIKYGTIDNKDKLIENLKQNAIPEEIFDMEMENYEEFLKLRRKLMSEKIRNYYESL